MKRARDIRDQLKRFLERVKIELTSKSWRFRVYKESHYIEIRFLPSLLQKNWSYKTVKQQQAWPGSLRHGRILYHENSSTLLRTKRCRCSFDLKDQVGIRLIAIWYEEVYVHWCICNWFSPFFFGQMQLINKTLV